MDTVCGLPPPFAPTTKFIRQLCSMATIISKRFCCPRFITWGSFLKAEHSDHYIALLNSLKIPIGKKKVPILIHAFQTIIPNDLSSFIPQVSFALVSVPIPLEHDGTRHALTLYSPHQDACHPGSPSRKNLLPGYGECGCRQLLASSIFRIHFHHFTPPGKLTNQGLSQVGS